MSTEEQILHGQRLNALLDNLLNEYAKTYGVRPSLRIQSSVLEELAQANPILQTIPPKIAWALEILETNDGDTSKI